MSVAASLVLPFKAVLAEVSWTLLRRVQDVDACSLWNRAWSNVRLLTVPRPQVTYIVCQKRHNTRLLPRSPNEADRSGNVPPGTVSLLAMLSSCLRALLISKCVHHCHRTS